MTGRLSLMKKTALFPFFLIMAFIILSGCTNTDNIDNSNDTSWHNCMDINGTVLGCLNPDSRVHLYQMERLDFPAVMNIIKATEPTGSAFLSTNQHFFFHCVPPGTYVLAIPASSYNSSYGSPIPEGRRQNNLSVRVIYQGGDSGYMVTVFTIERALHNSDFPPSHSQRTLLGTFPMRRPHRVFRVSDP